MEKGASSQVFLWLNSLGKGEQEPDRRLSTHLNPTCDSPAQVSYSGGSKMSLRGVFTDLVTLTHRPLGRQIHRYRIAFLVASVAMARVEVTGLHFFLCHTKFMASDTSAHKFQLGLQHQSMVWTHEGGGCDYGDDGGFINCREQGRVEISARCLCALDTGHKSHT